MLAHDYTAFLLVSHKRKLVGPKSELGCLVDALE